MKTLEIDLTDYSVIGKLKGKLERVCPVTYVYGRRREYSHNLRTCTAAIGNRKTVESLLPDVEIKKTRKKHIILEF